MWKRLLPLLAPVLLTACATRPPLPEARMNAVPETVPAVTTEGTAQIPGDGADGIDSPAKKYAALTFDDGPHPGTTDRLLDGLRQRGVHATFFLVGEEAAANRELVLRMKEEGHQVGNHTWSHQRLDYLRNEELVQEVGKADALLQSILGEGVYWLRPPYGRLRAGTESLIGVPMVKWSVDTRDWESRNAAAVVRSAMDAVEPNSVILLHDIYPTSVDAALELADRLSAEGYELVTVEELLRRNGVEPVPGQVYRSGNG